MTQERHSRNYNLPTYYPTKCMLGFPCIGLIIRIVYPKMNRIYNQPCIHKIRVTLIMFDGLKGQCLLKLLPKMFLSKAVLFSFSNLFRKVLLISRV